MNLPEQCAEDMYTFVRMMARNECPRPETECPTDVMDDHQCEVCYMRTAKCILSRHQLWPEK